MKPLRFYLSDIGYVDYLKNAEISAHGVSHVPDLDYAEGRKPKFLCGIVLSINQMDYYVPVSSFKTQRDSNFLIQGRNGKTVASLRFNYMFPIPPERVAPRQINSEPDLAYRDLLLQELEWCNKNREKIQSLAKRTHYLVVNNELPLLTQNSCDFLLLEQACREYCAEHGLTGPSQDAPRDLKALCAAARNEAAKINREHAPENTAPEHEPAAE